jgi:hypothetical protein
MRPRRAFIPSAWDRLEGRVALSHGAVAAPEVRILQAAPARTVELQGSVFGSLPGAAGGAVRAGRAFISPLRKVWTRGSLTIQPGTPTSYDGTVILTQIFGNGTLRVRISGTRGGPEGIASLRYEVVGGSGGFRQATGAGDVSLLQFPPSGREGRTPITLTFSATAPT